MTACAMSDEIWNERALTAKGSVHPSAEPTRARVSGKNAESAPWALSDPTLNRAGKGQATRKRRHTQQQRRKNEHRQGQRSLFVVKHGDHAH
jgi:hypothetical protein